jgi:hypothetical protein
MTVGGLLFVGIAIWVLAFSVETAGKSIAEAIRENKKDPRP